MKIGLLVSGGLGLVVLQDLYEKQSLDFVMTDKKSTAIIQFCSNKGVDCFLGNPRKGRSRSFVKDRDIEVLVSVNYLFLIEEDLIGLPKKCSFNLHGSLLPKYRGRTPHVWAIINGEKETGITAHLIDVGCDTGKIIEQRVVPIEKDDTGASMLSKFANEYPKLVNSVLSKVENDTMSTKVQDESKATYFGKRTPDDGLIEWEWSKERIQNWIRAQAPPYPGAFTYFDGEKIIIKSSKAIDLGFDFSVKNGTVLSVQPLTVKVCNGVLELELVNSDDTKLIRPNTQLG